MSAPKPVRGPGGLHRDVLGFLRPRAPEAHTVAVITTAVGGTSTGAVSRALKALTARHLVEAVPSSRPALWRAIVTPPTAPTSTTPAPSAPATGPIARPGGQLYYPRDLAGRTDVDTLRGLRAAGIPVLLYGPPGTGKTALAEAAHPDLITVAGDADTTVADLVGEYTQAPDGSFTFTYGPLVRAMTEGRALFIDDATLISPMVLAVLYPAMDGRGQIQVKNHTGETITAESGFYVLGGHNPGVHGAILTEALASRFSTHIEVTTDFDLARSLGAPRKAVTIARNLNAKLAGGEIGWAPQLRELLAARDLAAELGLDAALANLVAIAPAADRDLVRTVTEHIAGHPVVPLTLGAQLPTYTQPGAATS